MGSLNKNWFFEPVFDFEYKTYQLRGYIRDMKERFSESKFYPYLIDLQAHLDDVRVFQSGKTQLEESLSRELKEIDIRGGRLIRKEIADDTGVISELSQIVKYAHTHLAETYDGGIADLDKMAEEVQITPLGIVTATKSEGFLLFRKTLSTRIYAYNLRLVRRASVSQAFMDVKTSYLQEVRTGLLTNFNELKWQLIKTSGVDAALNAFLVESNTDLPQYETLLPIAKQYLIKNAVSA
jgi:hypothetical protein